ncbi:two-component system response regulator RppA [Merismopedia glauca]|uniref:DNA-binding response regulator n=1 Tax=Merismopedia glauca CCAP 1448/3 TaxID=1296344 RepID=A0A2T1C7H0_9CYAN|nr:two-component system response regulator RppA [Merismopedia glauca]PSB04186.1 DNA-binding response regulator [Merismopedia glauca CCAP 1448/3]
MRVLLVEDEPDLGSAIKKVLHQEKYVVDWLLDGTEAWEYLETQEYTLGVFDWLLPGFSGVELCQKLRDKGNSLPILMLTAKDSMADKVTGLDAGADDYLVKPFGMAELLARLRALQRRSPQFLPQKLQVGKLTLDYGTSSVNWDEQKPVLLTKKEFQLLEYLMQHPGQILTTEQIRDRLWDLGADPISNVVAAQIRLLRRKINQISAISPIETLRGIGYRFDPLYDSK